MKTIPSLFFACVVLWAVAGCGRKESGRPASQDKTYALKGEVISRLEARKTLLVHHEEIPGYMPPMTMEFFVSSADYDGLKEGQSITATMIEGKPGEFRLEHVRVVDVMKDSQVAAAAKALRQETLIRGGQAFREIGESVPRFMLYNQDNEVVSMDRFRGRRIVLNFIFTRCPVATMCPAATATMMKLQAEAKKRGITNLELISITLDPAYDTPAVLKEYAAVRGIDTRNFSFLTGPESAVRDLLATFGVLVEPGENIFKHTLSTILIDEKGAIVHRVDGSTWNPEDFLKRL